MLREMCNGKVAVLILRLAREEEAASASEYAILVALIAAAIFSAVSLFNLGNIFQVVAGTVQNCVNGNC